MINLLTYLTTQLKTIHPRVYLGMAPPNTAFPYVTFGMPTSSDQDKRQDFILEVDVWDSSTSAVGIETLTSNIDKLLNRLHYFSPGQFSIAVYRFGRLTIPDPDPAIKRRKLRYTCKTYFLN